MNAADQGSGISPGARADLATGRGLAEVAPFFGSSAAARRFVELAINPLLPELCKLNRPIRYADFGGGEGILAVAVADALARAEIEASVTVVDENPTFLECAKARGVKVLATSIERIENLDIDLGTLRLVNHYNSEVRQRAMLRAIARSSRAGASLVCQIHTADPRVCGLFCSIAALLDRSPAQDARHWVTLSTFSEMLTEAGFSIVGVYGESIVDNVSIGALLDDAWSRYYGQMLRAALTLRNSARAVELLRERAHFVNEARRRINVVGDDPSVDSEVRNALENGRALVTYPLLVCRR